MSRFPECLCAAVCVWLSSAASAAGPSIESVAPGIGQRGTEFELKLVGAGFGNAEEVLLYRSDVAVAGMKAASENELVLRLAASPDCALGRHAFRLRTQTGISELRTFNITPLPIVASVEPNDSAADAQRVALNVTVTGVVESDDVDSYRVTLKRGERLSAEVEGVRLGATLLDTALTIVGPGGEALAAADDNSLFRQDPLVSIVAPRDGDYDVQIRETNSEGDENSRYALHLGTFPRPAAVYPAGGQAGQTIDLRLIGDAAGDFTQQVKLPALPDSDFGIYAAQDGHTSPTPHPFRLSAFPNVLEREPNDEPSLAGQPTALPVALNGVIQQPGDVDHFWFEAEASQTWHLEVFADRLGSPLDAVASVINAAGDVLEAGDDYSSHDSRIVFPVPESGRYCLRITDKRGAGGPLFVYRVEATPRQPRLAAFMLRPNRLSQEHQTVSVPRGNRVLAYLGVQRVGVPGNVELAAGRLPDGVAMTAGRVAEDQFWTPVVLEAVADAPIAGRLVELEAIGQADGRSIYGQFKQVVDLVNGPGDALYQGYVADRMAVAVTEAAPFKLSLEPPTTPIAQDGTLALRVRVEREPGFDAPIDITFPFLPPWVDGPAKFTIPGNETAGVYVARAWSQAQPRTWMVCAEGKPGLSDDSSSGEPAPGVPSYRGRSRRRSTASRDIRVASQLVELTIAPPPVAGQMPSIAGEQGQMVKVVCRLNPKGKLPEQQTATLEGLPNRVTAEPVDVDSGNLAVEFAVRLSADAPLGEFPGLVCRLSGVLNGQSLSYSVARGGVLTVKPPGGLVTDDSGRPLSRLEVLRREKQQEKQTAPSSEE